MSDDVFEIATPFGDVAELGQGYINRADGERILLPLPSECAAGEGVRFIVHLTDGTPAFAGAGRCVQVSDQGATVVAAERFETLLDNLAFDDRSRPVYEYIVAVRQAVYAAGGSEAQEAQPVAEQELAVQVGAEPSAFSEAGQQAAAELLASDDEATAFIETAPSADEEATAFIETASAADDEATAFIETAASAAEVDDDPDALAAVVDESVAEILTASIPVPAEFSEPPAELLSPSQPAPALEAEADFALAPELAEAPVAASQPAPQRVASFAPPAAFEAVAPQALPTGMLKRPALASQWQPEPPRLPQPMRGTGLFRYPAGPLPVPANPPRPDLDPALRVQPAPAPVV